METRSKAIRVMLGVVGCLLTLGLGGGVSQAQPAAGPTAARRTRETMVVTAIDRTKRSVTLQNADGEPRTVGVPPDMKSFDTLKVGDHVDVDYYESIALAMMPPGTKSSVSESATGGRVEPRASPRRAARSPPPSRWSASTGDEQGDLQGTEGERPHRDGLRSIDAEAARQPAAGSDGADHLPRGDRGLDPADRPAR